MKPRSLRPRLHLLTPVVLGGLLAPGALAADTSVSVRMDSASAGDRAVATIRGEPRSPYALFVRHEADPLRVHPIDTGRLDPSGAARFAFELPPALLHSGLDLEFVALTLDDAGVRTLAGGAMLGCSALSYERFGADFHIGSAPVAAGLVLAEQWADVGLHVRAEALGGGADLAVAFDSSAPTGGDDDLRTPGAGTGNDFAFGMLTIVAENDVDMDGDGLIDDPDDNEFGGNLVYTWDAPVAVASVTLVDVDEPAGAMVRLFSAGVLLQSVTVPGLDDNNVQRVDTDPSLAVDELRVEFSGSGAVAEVEFSPCPLVLGFDASTTGIPFGRQTGEIVGTQWLSQGVTISGVTNDPAAPDAVVLFDTANPTGGDDDLRTPGPGIGNTVAQGQVIVLADNIIDANGDGLVDDPGDTATGGTMNIEFSYCVTLHSGTVLDIDTVEPDCWFEAFDENDVSIGLWHLVTLGDNSSQTIDFGALQNVRRLELRLCHSGALAELVYCPTPQ